MDKIESNPAFQQRVVHTLKIIRRIAMVIRVSRLAIIPAGHLAWSLIQLMRALRKYQPDPRHRSAIEKMLFMSRQPLIIALPDSPPTRVRQLAAQANDPGDHAAGGRLSHPHR